MNSRLFGYLVAGAFAAAIALAPPVLAFGGGHGGGGGGGWGGGGMGMHSMGSMGVGMSRGAIGARSFTAMPMSRAALAPNFSRAALAPRFSRAAFVPHHPFFFHHRFHRFNRFAFVGGPFFYGGYDDCWRRVWTAYGPQWVNLCADYGYGYY